MFYRVFYTLLFVAGILFFSPVFSASIIITEIGACESGNREWVEVMNTSEESIDFTQWKFVEQGSGHGIKEIGNDVFLPPRESAVIVDKIEEFLIVFPEYTGLVFDSSWGSLKNSGEEIALKNENGEIDPDEQFTYPACENARSLSRVGSDPQLSESWFLSEFHGTPGIINLVESIENVNLNETSTIEESLQENSVNEELDFEVPSMSSKEDNITQNDDLELDETQNKNVENDQEVNAGKGDLEMESSNISGLPYTVRITEIQSHKIGETEEWFEFTIEGNGIFNLSEWQVSNGNSVKKSFFEEKDKLIIGSGVIDLSTENQMIFEITDKARFYWTKSPISLANGGGMIQIMDHQDVILDSILYPDSKSGTSSGIEWSEVWNRDSVGMSFYPLIYKQNHQTYRHTRGTENYLSPVKPENIEILVTEISPNRLSETGHDFIELYVKSTVDDQANLKYLEIKHNGTSLFLSETDWIVEPGDFIVIKVGQSFSGLIESSGYHEVLTDKKDSISSGSGTVEVIYYSGTSWETTEDFVCWQKTELSATEQKRVDKNILEGYWNGQCYDISNIIKNESIGRNISFGDSQSASDFFRHFNGSEGQINESQNSPPRAIIQVQGTGRIMAVAPFSLNLTGEDSIDPDGVHDLDLFQWFKDGVLFSEKQNPESHRIPIPGTYKYQLKVTDYSGASNDAILTVNGVSPNNTAGIIAPQKEKIKPWIKKMLEKSEKKEVFGQYSSTTTAVSDDFFQNFLVNVDSSILEEIIKNNRVVPMPISSFDIPDLDDQVSGILSERKQANSLLALNMGGAVISAKVRKRKIQLSPEKRKRAEKNIGFIFVD